MFVFREKIYFVFWDVIIYSLSCVLINKERR